MRYPKLTAAAAAAAALLALAPAGAGALKGHPRLAAGGCHLKLFAEPHLLTSGETAQVFGALLCPGGTGAGQTVTVYEHSAGVPGYTVIGSPVAGAGGAYSVVSPAISANSTFYALAAGARSPIKQVRVAPQVTVAGPTEGAQILTGVGHRVIFTGTVSPADVGAEVVLEREQATSVEEWGIIQQHDFVATGGVFAIVHRFIVPGDANLRVIVRPHNRTTSRGISNTLSYEISQAQNPRLTISTSAEPVTYGMPVTLTGIVAGGANEKVKLMAHTAKTPFVQVGEGMTNGGGAYTFTIPSSTANTYYEVTNGSIHSAVLFEGVRYLLTTNLIPAKAQAGQPLTWSGTVTPGLVGKVVYLERRNANSGAFHVVDLTTVQPGSTYSITHYLFGMGNQTYRVRVPGDPANQATSSLAQTIEVTPAPPASLKPVPQGSQPH